MADLPTQTDLYQEFKAQVLGDPTTQLNNFDKGSALYTFSQVAATMGRAGMRWFAQTLKASFFSTAEGADLDYKATDVFGEDRPQRDSGMSDEEYLTKIYAYVDSLIRGTVPSFEYWLVEYDGRADSVRIVEHLKEGYTDIYIEPSSEVSDVGAYLEELRGERDKWRTLNGSVNLREET